MMGTFWDSRSPSHRGRVMSAKGVEFIKKWEGFAPRAYRDVAGVWTIGYGHTEGFSKGVFCAVSCITEAEAERILIQDIAPRANAVDRLVEVETTQNAFDALVSFHFNTGGLGRSTALRRLNAGDLFAAAEALTWWNKARIAGRLTKVTGLVRRRAAEADLLLRPDEPERDKDSSPSCRKTFPAS